MDHAHIKDVLNNNDTIIIVEQDASRAKNKQDKIITLTSHGTQTLRCDKDYLWSFDNKQYLWIMAVASQIGYDITDKFHKNMDVTQDHKKAKLFQDMKAEQHVINDNNKHAGKALPLKSNDPRAIFDVEGASSV